jgi:purine-cytosine permease-like protein
LVFYAKSKKIRRSTLYGRVQYYEFFHAYLQVLSACISPFKGLKVVDHIALILEHSLLSGLNDFQQKEICMQNELSWTNDLCLHIMSHCALDVLENPETLDYPTQYI